MYMLFMLQNNKVVTSKYSIISFLPRNLLEQFMRVANIYFLILLLMQLIPEVVPQIPSVSSVGSATTIIPLLLVLGVTAVKDAFDDIVSCKSILVHFPLIHHCVLSTYVRIMYLFTATDITHTFRHVSTCLSMCAVCIVISIRERSLLKEMIHLYHTCIHIYIICMYVYKLFLFVTDWIFSIGDYFVCVTCFICRKDISVTTE